MNTDSVNQMTLNKLPDGSPSPEFLCTAVSRHDPEDVREAVLTEWWYAGEKVQSIQQSANEYFYDAFDKEAFKLLSVEELEK